jgi:hypothetical protein
MPKTVVGVMDTPEKAQRVVQDLVARGIPRGEIGLRGNEGQAVQSTAALNESEGSIDSPGIVVAVAAQTETQVQGALDILRRHHAAAIEFR